MRPSWHDLEWVFVIGFGVEYLAHHNVSRGRLRQITSPWGLVERFTILQSVFLAIGEIVACDFPRTLRVLRVPRASRTRGLAVTRLPHGTEHSGNRMLATDGSPHMSG